MMINQGKCALAVHRYGQWVDRLGSGPHKWALDKVYWMGFSLSEVFFGISLPKSVEIGSNLTIWHFGSIIIHPNVKIGSDCILRQGVTLGNRRSADDTPTIGNGVEFGAYAQVLGKVSIGNNCKIGAMSVVLQDVPDNCTAVGNPARILGQ